MRTIIIQPLQGSIHGEVKMPGSKSFTARALIMASLAKGKSILYGASESEDSVSLIRALKKLGISIVQKRDTIKIQGNGGAFAPFYGTLRVGDAGTTMRFLTSLCALIPGEIILDGSCRMRERPIGELVNALQKIGARIAYGKKEGSPPLKIKGSHIVGGSVLVDGSISSQYITSLLLVAPLLEEGLTIDIKGEQASPSYIDMTIEGLKNFGVNVENFKYKRYTLLKGATYKPLSTESRTYGSGLFLRPAPSGAGLQNKKAHYYIEGDASSASYFWAIAAITGSTIKVRNINPLSSQGDVGFPYLLEKMGCKVRKSKEARWIEVTGASALKSIQADMSSMPDSAQTLAVVASFAKGTSKITGLSTLQIKENRRLTALKKELQKMGIGSDIGDDFIEVHGDAPKGACIKTYNDHRMAMAFAVAGAKIKGMRIENPGVVKKSFPKFWETLQVLGVSIHKR